MVVDSPLVIDSRIHTTQLQCTLGDTGGMDTDPRESETVSDRASPEKVSCLAYHPLLEDLRSTFRWGVCVGAIWVVAPAAVDPTIHSRDKELSTHSYKAHYSGCMSMHDEHVHDVPCFHATCTLLIVCISLERQLIRLATVTWMPEAPTSTSVAKREVDDEDR